MNNEIWNKIVEFDFDSPLSEYGFSTRLANENYWTQSFTQTAIQEYRKFMYLAATSNQMVSPSEIVDVVWHQHLIFTQSYHQFCRIIGKEIQHIPSTHNKEDFSKFKQAKERTKQCYKSNFGEQPASIWENAGMFESLSLHKAKLKIRTFIIIGILSFALLTIPCYYFLKPFYLIIDNPEFIFGFIALTIAVFLGLEIFNRNYLSRTANQFNGNSFIFDLQPLELVYLKTQKLSNVVNGVVNELIEEKKIIVNSDHSLEKAKIEKPQTVEAFQIMDVMDSLGRTFYPNLLRQLILKPIFGNTAKCMDAFKKHFYKSKKFSTLFYINFGVLSVLLMLGFVRLSTGLLRDKPIAQIFLGIIVLIVLVILYLKRLTNLICTETIPKLYKNTLLPQRQVHDNWQWQYFLMGKAGLAMSFIPIVNYIDKNNSNYSGSCGTSCGSSCGSSCSSCGGCGGD